MISVGASSRALRNRAMTKPTASPIATPTTALSTKRPLASASEKLPLTTAATANL